MRRFTIDTHDGFRAAEPDQQPAAVLQFELESIYCDELCDLQPAKRLGIGLENHLLPRLAFTGEGRIDPVIKMFTDFLEEHLQQFGRLLTSAHHKIEKV